VFAGAAPRPPDGILKKGFQAFFDPALAAAVHGTCLQGDCEHQALDVLDVRASHSGLATPV
jgi:hypothetical protein